MGQIESQRKPTRRSPPSRPPPSFQRSPRSGGDPTSFNTNSTSLSSDVGGGAHWSSSDFSHASTCSSAVSGIREALSGAGPTIFSFSQISQATDGFAKACAVARSVWRGVLKSRGSVAITRRQGCPTTTSSEEFHENLKLVNSLNHANIAKLLGACRDKEYLYLVYEFVEGSNLRTCLLRGPPNPMYSILPTWLARVQIAADVAKGLEYLHHLAGGDDHAFIHKHIKSSNVLVTNDRRAKIAFFGVAELTGELADDLRQMKKKSAVVSVDRGGGNNRRALRSNSIKITASQGYTPPEYLSEGILTLKYDVFGYGVVLLELLSGREPFSLNRVSIVEEIQSILDNQNESALRLWMDEALNDSYPIEDVYRVIALARSCVNTDPQKRPEMTYVVRKLSNFLESARKWQDARQSLTTSIHVR